VAKGPFKQSKQGRGSAIEANKNPKTKPNNNNNQPKLPDYRHPHRDMLQPLSIAICGFFYIPHPQVGRRHHCRQHLTNVAARDNHHDLDDLFETLKKRKNKG
jgi:hypothetical protein